MAKEKMDRSRQKDTFIKVLNYMKPYWFYLALSLVLAAVTVALTLYPVSYTHLPEGVQRVDAEEICYMEAFAHSCELHTLSECITVKSGISALEKEAVRLGVPLFRCHRSYAVNIAQVRAIEREAALLSDGSRIPVSRRLYQELNRQFIDYFLKRER